MPIEQFTEQLIAEVSQPIPSWSLAAYVDHRVHYGLGLKGHACRVVSPRAFRAVYRVMQSVERLVARPILRDLDCLVRALYFRGRAFAERKPSLGRTGQRLANSASRDTLSRRRIPSEHQSSRLVSCPHTSSLPALSGASPPRRRRSKAPPEKTARANRSGTGSQPYPARSKAATRPRWPAIIITDSRPTST